MKGYHFVVVLLALGLVGTFCLKPPVLPRWDVDVNVPLYQGNLRVADFLKSPVFQILPDSSICLNVDYRLDTLQPVEVLELRPVNATSRISPSDFLLMAAGRGRLNLALSDVAGVPIPDSGMKARLGPFANSLERSCPLEGIAEVEIDSGLAVVTCHNYTEVPFDSLQVESPFGMLAFGYVAPHSEVEARLDVAGTTVSSPVSLSLFFRSPGTGGDTVQLNKYDSLVVEFRFDSLRIGSGRLKIPAAVGERRCSVAVGSARPFRIDSLTLASGTFSLGVQNDYDLTIDAVLQVPQLGIVRSCHLPPHGSDRIEMDLAGLLIRNEGSTGLLLKYDVLAVPEPTEGYVTIARDDALVTTSVATGLVVDAIVGEFLQPCYLASGRDTILRIPFGISGLRVPSAEVALDMTSEVGFPMDVMIRGVAERDGQEIATVDRTFRVEPGQPGAARTSEFTFPVTDLINAGPDVVAVEYNTRIMGAGSYHSGACMWGRATMSTPMRVALEPDTILTPARRVLLSDAQRTLREKHLVGAGGILHVANRLPFSFTGRLILAPDSTAVFNEKTMVDSVVIPFGVRAGGLDPHGNCVYDSDTTLDFEMDSLDLSLFNTWPLSARLVIEVPATDTVNVRASDRMALDALLKLRLRIEE